MRRAPAGERLERNGGPVRDYVIMGRALDAGSPFHDNGFSNRPIGSAPARSGQVIMGRAVGSGSPVRPGRTNRVVGGCRVIMGRALKVGSPLRGNGFSNRPTGHAPAGSDRVCMAAARSAGSPRCAVAPGLDRWARAGGAVALVIMGRALDAGSPFHDNGFSNRPIGGAPARSGQVIMGRAVGPGSPVRPGRTNRVVGGCRVIMGRALKVGSPLRGNGFSNRPTGHAPAGSDRVCMAAARSAGSPRCAVAPGLDRWARAGGAVALVIMGRALDAGSPFHDNGFSNRPIGGAPARSGQVIMGRAVGSGSPVRPGRTNRVVGGCRVIMGRALKVGSPLRGNGFSNRPIGHAPAGSDRVCMAAARSAGSPRCAVAPGLDRWARAGGAVAW